MIEPIILTIFAFVLGSVPSAYILGKKFHGVNIKQIGNKNVGTVNAWRNLGWKTGLSVLILDAGKGAAVMALILALGIGEWLAFAMALAVTLGHNFSIFLNFKGGKGAAVVLGLSLVILPILTLLTLLIIPVTYYFVKSIIWSIFAAFVVLNILTITTGQAAAQVGLCVVLSIVVIATHLWRERREFLPAIYKFDLTRLGRIE